MATKIIGLDLGTQTVKVCELVTTFRNYELVGFGSEAVDSPPGAPATFTEIAAAARRLLDARGILGETLMCALPSGLLSTVTLSFPFDPKKQKKQIEQTLPMELDELIPFDLDDVVYDHQIFAKPEGGAHVVVSFVKRAILRELLDALTAEGIDPKVLSSGGLSFFNLYELINPNDAEEGALALLDVGHQNAELAIFCQGRPVLIRDIHGGGAGVTAALAEAFGVDIQQAEHGKLSEGWIGAQTTLAKEGQRRQIVNEACHAGMEPVLRELRRALAAHEISGGAPVRRLYLTGGGALLSGLAAHLQATLSVEVAPLNVLNQSFNRLALQGDRDLPYIPKALALSLRAFHPTHQSQMNFRKEEFAYTGDFGFLRGRIISLALSMIMIIILGAMVAVAKKRVLEAEYQTLNQQVLALSQPILGHESGDAELILSTVLAGAKSKAQLPETSAFEILAALSEKIGFEITMNVDRFEVDLERKFMDLTGTTGTSSDVERIVDVIRQIKCFKGEVKKERVEKFKEDTKFRLKASSTCG
ncbi:pilus assembly protein PilM [Myxococcota bacterium]|nr:pilus assembly protein PilM [Myxococcota bacterium]